MVATLKDWNVKMGAPCQWSKEQGATHTVNGSIPARVLKSVIYLCIGRTSRGIILWDKIKIS